MKPPFDHFNLLARWYDRLMPSSDIEPLLELIAAQPGQTVLDVGGGTGRVSSQLQAAGAHVVVCDMSWEMARQAQGKGLSVVLGSAAALPFATACADRILVVEAFHHFVGAHAERTQVQAAFEMLRALAPGGRLVLDEPDIRRRPARVAAFIEKLLLMRSRFLLPADLIALFHAAGARTQTVTDGEFSTQIVFTK